MFIFISAVGILILLLITAKLAFTVPLSNSSVGTIPDTVVSKAITTTVTILTFPKTDVQRYAERMATVQPISNDRLLKGKGKNHTLRALATTVSSGDSSVISVLQQVGDAFS